MQYFQDEHFKLFAGNLERAIDAYGGMDEETLVERQRNQIDTLVSLEKQFRKALIRHPWGAGVYRAFIHMIVHDRRNILAARPYFRERQDVFTENIAKALKSEREKSLYRFHFNYQFVLFAVKLRKWPKGSEIRRLAREIARMRTELIEMNMPLAISRARIFFSRTPKAHLTYMDFIQIACEGLMSAVDKFVPPYSKVFRSVAIGRMVGNFIEHYSETLVHFYPQDKRKIYRANKLVGKHGQSVDFDALAAEINARADDGCKTNADEISSLLAAASCVSTDTSPPGTEDDIRTAVERYAADEAVQPDVQYETAEATHALEDALSCLTLFERKLLALKGVNTL